MMHNNLLSYKIWREFSSSRMRRSQTTVTLNVSDWIKCSRSKGTCPTLRHFHPLGIQRECELKLQSDLLISLFEDLNVLYQAGS